MNFISILPHFILFIYANILRICCEETISITTFSDHHNFLKWGKTSYFWNLTVYGGRNIFEIWPFTVAILTCFCQWLFSSLPCLTVKEVVNEVSVNVINQESINIVSNIYHPSQPLTPKPTIIEIEIIKYLVTFTLVTLKNTTALKV